MKTGSKALLTGTGLVAAFAIFFGVNVLSNQGLRSARIDLTEARLYTLSDGTRNVIKAIPEPITLRFFFSDRLSSAARSEEHTSELQSIMRSSYAVFCLKKKKTRTTQCKK